MSFLKTKKFWIPFSVVGIGVIAIGTGVGIHQRNQNAINIYEGDSRGEIRTKLRNALNTINANDIRVNLNPSGINRKSLTQTASESGLYAFNVSSNQLGLSSNVSVPFGIQIGFELNKDKNTLQTLNDGVLNIKLIATTPFSNQVETRDLALNTFKKADEKLNRLVNQNNTNLVLEIKQTKETDKYKTIEQLNAISSSISGLTSLLRNNISEFENSNNLSIQGKVKLDRITVENSKVYFYLTSANDNYSLKLVDTSNNEIKQILFKEVKLTNLAASKVIAVPNGYLSKQGQIFTNKLKTSLKKDNGLYVTVPNSTQTTNGSTNSSVNVNIKPYFVQNPQNSTTLRTAIQVVFGNKVYDTNKSSDFATLKNAGFKFNIYSKLLSKTDQDLSEMDIVGNMMKLETFFKQDHFSKPTDKPTSMPQMFTNMALDLSSNQKTIQIMTNKQAAAKSGRVQAQAQMQDCKIQNWLLVADYSYTGINSGNKVLFTPVLSVVHLEKTLMYDGK